MELEQKEIKTYEKYGIKCKKIIHSGWMDWVKWKKKSNNKLKSNWVMPPFSIYNHPLGIFGKWQYIFQKGDSKISLIELLDYYRIGERVYEIFLLSGNEEAKKLLPDATRFSERTNAIKEILSILK